ncbi:MAG: DUF368 domain-containing protein [Balneolaceae bacterium]|nr:DUF368 domain-containing protein [Balneolaceae bacterium]
MSREEGDAAKTDPTSWSEWPGLISRGFVMGSADIIPGVSGGTMALILGIYSRLIHAIRSVDLSFFRCLLRLRWREALAGVHWRFLVLLVGGILLAVVFFTRVVPLQIYMHTHPELIYGLFFGLILGSIFILVKALEHFGWAHALLLAAGALAGWWTVTLVPAATPETPLFVFLSGSVAICAMVLPGISGSYLLLILGKYDYILSQLALLGGSATVEGLLALLPFFGGAAVGLALFTRLLSWLLDRHYGPTLAVLIGFLVGSLYMIWPWQQREYREFTRVEAVVEVGSDRAGDLRDRQEDPDLPEFERLGEVLNPDVQGAPRQVEILRVQKKLVRSTPELPAPREQPGESAAGAAGAAAGLLMVVALERMQRRMGGDGRNE